MIGGCVEGCFRPTKYGFMEWIHWLIICSWWISYPLTISVIAMPFIGRWNYLWKYAHRKDPNILIAQLSTSFTTSFPDLIISWINKHVVCEILNTHTNHTSHADHSHSATFLQAALVLTVLIFVVLEFQWLQLWIIWHLAKPTPFTIAPLWDSLLLIFYFFPHAIWNVLLYPGISWDFMQNN